VADHNDFGKKGEQIAVDYLRGKGFRILETNWRRGRNEIDIIARDGKALVVVEVKSRHSILAGEPETAVTREKQRALIRAANAYVLLKRISDEVRFDIVSILIENEKEKIRHIPDAFYPLVR
jgi:putative endonuclease